MAGLTMLILACTGLGIPPVGLIFTCVGGPLAVFAFGYAFGAAQTRVDEEGVYQRNFFFMTKNFKWNEIESGKITSVDYDYKDSSGWTSRRTRTNMSFVSTGKSIHINVNSSGPEGWWGDLKTMAKEKLGERFES